MSESIILYLADPSSYRYLHRIQDVGQMQEPLQMPLERWEAGMQQPPPRPRAPTQALPYRRCSRFQPCTAVSSSCQFFSMLQTQLRGRAPPSLTPLHTLFLCFAAFFSIFPHFIAAQFTSPKTHHEESSLLPSNPCPSFSRRDGSTWGPSPGLGLAALGLLYGPYISSCPLS